MEVGVERLIWVLLPPASGAAPACLSRPSALVAPLGAVRRPGTALRPSSVVARPAGRPRLGGARPSRGIGARPRRGRAGAPPQPGSGRDSSGLSCSWFARIPTSLRDRQEIISSVANPRPCGPSSSLRHGRAARDDGRGRHGTYPASRSSRAQDACEPGDTAADGSHARLVVGDRVLLVGGPLIVHFHCPLHIPRVMRGTAPIHACHSTVIGVPARRGDRHGVITVAAAAAVPAACRR